MSHKLGKRFLQCISTWRKYCVEGNSSDILLYLEIRDLQKFLKKTYIVDDCFVDYRKGVSRE